MRETPFKTKQGWQYSVRSESFYPRTWCAMKPGKVYAQPGLPIIPKAEAMMGKVKSRCFMSSEKASQDLRVGALFDNATLFS